MSKKEFKSGLDFLLQGSSHPQEEDIKAEILTTMEDSEVRATFIVSRSQLKELKVIAFWHRKQIKQVLQEALALYISNISKEDFSVAMLEYHKLKNKQI